MYSYLFGILADKSPESAVIDCMGVGYLVNIPLSTYEKLPDLGEKTKLFIHYSFNEMDGAKLFGFKSLLEKNLFKMLIGISKIGPKIGLAVLSGLPASDFVKGILQEDVVLLSTISGIGKKSAERLIIELKDKVTALKGLDDTEMSLDESTLSTKEAESALFALGYKQYEIRSVINELTKKEDFASSEELIKAAIKSLYNKRKK